MEVKSTASPGVVLHDCHYLFPKGMSVIMMSIELVRMGKQHRSQRTVSIGNPHALKQMLNSYKCSVTAKMYRKRQIRENVSIRTCLYLPSAFGCGRCY